MAFRVLEPSRGLRAPLTVPTVAVYAGGMTSISIPLETLRLAGIDAKVGDRFDLAVGEGEDANKVAIAPGEGFTSTKVGSGATALSIKSSRVGKATYSSQPVARVEAHGGTLILTFPADFPWEAPPRAAAPASIFNHARAA